MSTAIILCKTRAEHIEFVDEIRKSFGPPYGLTIVKSKNAKTDGAKLIDHFCDEFLTLSKLMKRAPAEDVLVLYAIGDWNLQPHETGPFSAVMQKRPDETMEQFVRSIR